MDASQDPNGTNRAKVTNLAIAGLLGQVGCVTLLIVLAALFGGLWLDARLGTRPAATLVLVILSIPVSLLVMLKIVRFGIAKIKPISPAAKPGQNKEENFGKNS